MSLPSSEQQHEPCALCFATSDTVEQCCNYLESCLAGVGLSFKLNPLSGSREDSAGICNCIYVLLQRYNEVAALKDRYQDEQRSLRFDLQSSDKTIARLTAQLEAKQHEIGDLAIKLRQQEAHHKADMQALDHAGAELARRVQQLEQRQVQAQHEIKRKDVEVEKLQARLRGALAGPRTCAGHLEPAPAVAASANKRANRQTREQEDLHKRVVDAFETKTHELEHENRSLRSALARLQEQHRHMLQHMQQAQQPSYGSAVPTAHTAQASPDLGTRAVQRRRWSHEQQPVPSPADTAASPPVALHAGIINSPMVSPASIGAGSLSSLSDAECGAVIVPEPRSVPRSKAVSKSLFDEAPSHGYGAGCSAAAEAASAGLQAPGSSLEQAGRAGWRHSDSSSSMLGAGMAGAGGFGCGMAALDASGRGGFEQGPSVGDLRARMHDIKLRCKRQLSGGGAAAAGAAGGGGPVAATAEERQLQLQLDEAQLLIQEQDRVLRMMLGRVSSGAEAGQLGSKLSNHRQNTQ